LGEIYTITPWIEGYEEPEEEQMDGVIRPRLRVYHGDWLEAQKSEGGRSRRPFFACETHGGDQYSVNHDPARPFLNDLDPSLENDPQKA